MTDITRYEQFFEILTEVNRVLHQGDNLDEVLQTIVSHIRRIFKAKGCVLRVLNPATRELDLKAAAGLSQTYLDKGCVIGADGLTEVYDEQPVVISDIDTDMRVQYPDAARAEGIGSIMGFPFKIMDNLRMVLRLYFEQPLHLDPAEVRFIESLTAQCALVIKQSFLQTRYFDTFRKVSRAIHAGEDVDTILKTIVSRIKEIMAARGCIFWILDRQSRTIKMRVMDGFLGDSLARVSFEALQHIFDLENCQSVFIRNIHEDERIAPYRSLGKRLVVSMVGMPFDIVDSYSGILAVYFGETRDLRPSETNFIRALGEQGAIALHRALRQDEKMLQAFRETIEGLVLALEARDVCTHGHSLKVARYARRVAEQMALPEKTVDTIGHAAMLHDIGKIAMHDEILINLGKLSPTEYDIIRKHPVIGAKIIKPLSFLDDVVPLILHHHERYNGTGYPQGLAGEEIPLGARIISVCDSFDAMLSDRPGGGNLCAEMALAMIQKGSGTYFDPQVVNSLVAVIETDPAVVQPFRLPEGYLEKYKQELSEIKKRKLSQLDWSPSSSPSF